MRVRAAEAADDAARDALHRECFGFAPPAGMWRWKYRDNPHGTAIDHVVEEQDRVVAAFALVPRYFSTATGEVLAMQAADAMTARGERQRGHYARLLESTAAVALERGAPWLFAFGGSQSEGSFQRARWNPLRRTQMLRLRCRTLHSAYRAWRFARCSETFAELPKTELKSSAFDGGSVAGRRDLKWLQWRLKSPRYSLWTASSGAIAIIERWQDRAVLSDLMPAARWMREASLWHGLLRTLRLMGVDTVDATVVDTEALRSMVRATGWSVPRSQPVRSLWTKPLVNDREPVLFASPALWLRDLDRDAEGLFMRAEADAACRSRV